MTIPETFTIFGVQYKVVYDDQLVYRENNKGEAHVRFEIVKIQSDTEGVPHIRERQEQTFLHELVHIILCEMGEEDLSLNEQFVQLFSKMLHQVLK